MRKRKILFTGLVLLLVGAGAIVAYLGWPQPEYMPYQYGSADRDQLPRLTLLNHDEVMHTALGHPSLDVKTIGIVVYDGVDTLEAIAPMVVFSELMGVDVVYIGRQTGIVQTTLADITIEDTFADIAELDVLVVPGGNREGLQAALADPELRTWLQTVDKTTTLTARVGYGTCFWPKQGCWPTAKLAGALAKPPSPLAPALAKGGIPKMASIGLRWEARPP